METCTKKPIQNVTTLLVLINGNQQLKLKSWITHNFQKPILFKWKDKFQIPQNRWVLITGGTEGVQGPTRTQIPHILTPTRKETHQEKLLRDLEIKVKNRCTKRI